MDTLAQLRNGQLAGATRLDLSCGLTEIPREIFELAETLEILNLSGNCLHDLPQDLARLKKLRILFCSQNNFEHLPDVIGNLPSLQMLGFKSNRIARVDEASLPPSLRWLILTDNRIEQLPSSIGKCLPLQKLMLAGNRLSHLPEEMARCVNLELIRLAANQFEVLPDWLFHLPKLSWLAYSGNPVAAEAPGSRAGSIAWDELELMEKLGEGASGVISRARWQNGSRHVAVKVFKGEMTSDGPPASEKAACLAAGAHPHLVPVIAELASHPEDASGLVMEWIGGGFTNLAGPPDFQSCTRDVYAEDIRFPPSVLLKIARGIAEAARALHAKGIMHGDLYAHNILRDEEGHALLGDFGAATFHGRRDRLAEKVEVRAFGCLLEELLERWEGSKAPEELRDLVRHCMDPEVARRPGFPGITTLLRAFGLPSGPI